MIISVISFLAYKHLGIHPRDFAMQFLAWGGRLFSELRLTFGCSSSPGLFDVASDVIKELAARMVGMLDMEMLPKCKKWQLKLLIN